MVDPIYHPLDHPKIALVLGFVGAFSVGLPMMDGHLFWIGAIICYAAALGAFARYRTDIRDLVGAKRRLSEVARWDVVLVICIILVEVSLPTYLIWKREQTVPIPMIVITQLPVEPSPGTDVDGIKWEKGLSEIDIIIENNNNDEYLNIDAFIWSNGFIKYVSTRSNGQCQVQPANPNMHQYDGFVIEHKPSGDEISKDNTSQYYRIYCDRIINHSQLHITLAVPAYGFIWSPRIELGVPAWAAVAIRYQLAGSNGETFKA